MEHLHVQFFFYKNKMPQFFQRQQKVKDWTPIRSDEHLPFRHFTLKEIIAATNNFNYSLKLGKGGFWNTYKGFIDDGTTIVAIKRLGSLDMGRREFLIEIEMLSRVKHCHLVSLIGYCIEKGERILVYDYMVHGSLRDLLDNYENSPLEWKQLLEICIGAAKGSSISTVMLIVPSFTATSNLPTVFWAKLGSQDIRFMSHSSDRRDINTNLSLDIGTLDPQYFLTHQLTNKSDVYSFGVVLLEVLTAWPAILQDRPSEKVNIAKWARVCHWGGRIDEIIDSNLNGQIAVECLKVFVETAIRCVEVEGVNCLEMDDVLWNLELARSLQEGSGRVFVSSETPQLLNSTDIFSQLGLSDEC